MNNNEMLGATVNKLSDVKVLICKGSLCLSEYFNTLLSSTCNKTRGNDNLLFLLFCLNHWFN